MAGLVYITPAHGGISGGKIGVDGDQLWIFPEKMEPNFRVGLINVTKEASEELSFVPNGEIGGTLRIRGMYKAEGDTAVPLHNALNTFRKRLPVAVIVTLDTGHAYSGNVLLVSDNAAWDRRGSEVPLDMTFQFTGRIDGCSLPDSSQGDYDSGTYELDLLDGASRHIDYQDERGDSAVRQVIVHGWRGIDVPLDTITDSVIATLGGNEHTYPGDDTLYLRGGTTTHIGIGVTRTMVSYSRWLLDCRYRSKRHSVAYATDERLTNGAISGGSDDDACANLAEMHGLGDLALLNTVPLVVPLKVHYMPCVWETNPEEDGDDFVGKINANTIVIDGKTKAALSLRFDGFAGISSVQTPRGEFWVGDMKFTEKVGGWISGRLVCLQMVALPLEGDQTLPSYTYNGAFRNFYEYADATFLTLAQLCNRCYD